MVIMGKMQLFALLAAILLCGIAFADDTKADIEADILKADTEAEEENDYYEDENMNGDYEGEDDWLVDPMSAIQKKEVTKWFQHFVGWWNFKFGWRRFFVYGNADGTFTIKHTRDGRPRTIKLRVSNVKQFPAEEGWYYFIWCKRGYYVRYSDGKMQVSKFVPAPESGCDKPWKGTWPQGMKNYCGNVHVQPYAATLYKYFVGLWNIDVGGSVLSFNGAANGFITKDKQKIKLTVSNDKILTYRDGFCSFRSGNFWYYIKYVPSRKMMTAYKFSVNDSCKRSYRGKNHFCGAGYGKKGSEINKKHPTKAPKTTPAKAPKTTLTKDPVMWSFERKSDGGSCGIKLSRSECRKWATATGRKFGRYVYKEDESIRPHGCYMYSLNQYVWFNRYSGKLQSVESTKCSISRVCICKKIGIPTKAPTKAPKCKNIIPDRYCAGWAANGICGRYASYMKKWCKCACK